MYKKFLILILPFFSLFSDPCLDGWPTYDYLPNRECKSSKEYNCTEIRTQELNTQKKDTYCYKSYGSYHICTCKEVQILSVEVQSSSSSTSSIDNINSLILCYSGECPVENISVTGSDGITLSGSNKIVFRNDCKEFFNKKNNSFKELKGSCRDNGRIFDIPEKLININTICIVKRSD